MTDQQSIWRQFPRSFWTANAMEIFERMGWYGFYAVSTLYLTNSVASPRSKEYAGRIAPPEKVGMYMGYFYWCVALGNLFGGLLSGVAYQHFGPHGIDRPGAMWVLFAVLAVTTAVALIIYNKALSKFPTAEDVR